MPRGFTDKETKYYMDKLLTTGTTLFGKSGLSGVSIDQIVKEVGIAKGSFYKFFKNKEDLCFDCLMKLETNIKTEMEETLLKYKGNPGALMKGLIYEIPRIIDEYPLISIFQNRKELESLMLRVDESKHMTNFQGDSLFLGNIVDGTNILKKTNKETLTGFVWSLVLLSLNKDFFKGQFSVVLELIGNMAESHFSDNRSKND